MEKRDIRIEFRLNEKEFATLDRRVKKSGLSRENYLRHLIRNLIPADQPPPDYFSMMRTLNAIGNNLDQVAQKAYVLNVIDVQRYVENVTALDSAIVEITNAVMLPRKV